MEREDWIESEVYDLMEYGHEYFPFSYRNIMEAMAEMSEADAILFTGTADAAELQPKNEWSQKALSSVVLKVIRNYWEKAATFKAELNYEEYRCASLSDEKR